MLRRETRVRARALQILYAWEQRPETALRDVAHGLLGLHAARDRTWLEAERLAETVAADAVALDGLVAQDLAHWRLERVGVIERNILRLGVHELREGATPAPVVISEGVRLAHWFAGSKAPPFVNGVLDAAARRLGRL
ncbi:MAG TPA: transcription antitermination factor NusB [Gemmatimonadales bacterium]|nr:transcription antitermination factor NusB [Gemmatimonadales bacterium]